MAASRRFLQNRRLFLMGLSPMCAARADAVVCYQQNWKSFHRVSCQHASVYSDQVHHRCQRRIAQPSLDLRQLSACWTFKVSLSKVMISYCVLSPHKYAVTTDALPSGVTGLQSVRFKSGGKKGKASSGSSSEEESDVEELDDDDYDAPTNFKRMTIYLKSLRTDSVVSSALDIARNRVDEIFYGSRLRLNGEKLLKKSKQMEEGDYADLIMERSSDTDQLLVKRVKVISISPERTNKEKSVVTVKVWKSPFPIEDDSKAEWRRDE